MLWLSTLSQAWRAPARAGPSSVLQSLTQRLQALGHQRAQPPHLHPQVGGELAWLARPRFQLLGKHGTKGFQAAPERLVQLGSTQRRGRLDQLLQMLVTNRG